MPFLGWIACLYLSNEFFTIFPRLSYMKAFVYTTGGGVNVLRINNTLPAALKT